jgi:hypothetical protein
MHTYLEFNEDLCGSMGRAFDQACEQIPLAALFPELRTAMAERILSNASKGVHEIDALRADVLAAFHELTAPLA